MEAQKLIQATCPDCRGPLAEIHDGDMVEFRCLVGHRFSPRSILEGHSEAQESALWAAVVALEESANLVRAIGPYLPRVLADRLEQQSGDKLRLAAKVREILAALEPFQLE